MERELAAALAEHRERTTSGEDDTQAEEPFSEEFAQALKRIHDGQESNDFRALKDEREAWSFTTAFPDAASESEQQMEAEFEALLEEPGVREKEKVETKSESATKS
jgi:hypothetical protein